MPLLLDHIDKIARDQRRGVLYLEFDDSSHPMQRFDDQYSEARSTVIRWLEENGIPYRPCAGIASPNLIEGYQGQLYIDVPYDPNDETYRKLERFLEDDSANSGKTRFAGVRFCFLSLELAMRNKHHDAPGFWERLSE